MLKRKFKIIALLFVMISTFTFSTVKAENETENASAISEDSATVTSNEQDLETTSSSGETSAIASYENNFKKDVKEDKGLVNKIVGFKNELSISGIQYDRPIYQKERLFASYTGYCKIHHMRKEMLEKKKEGKPSPFHKTDALLAICTPQSPDCIPIYIGDTVEIAGTKMMVKTNIFGRYHTRTFLQMPVSASEKAAEAFSFNVEK